MPSIIILHPNDRREIRYEAKEGEEPQEVLYTRVYMMPAELDRIKTAKSEEVQQILRRYI